MNVGTLRRPEGLLTVLLLAAVLVAAPAVQAQAPSDTLTQDIESDLTLDSDTTYYLDGLVFVGPPTIDANGNPQNLDQEVTLTIEPGTVIRGIRDANVSTGESGSALIVRRSGKIMADGTPENPIIFTSDDDDLSDPFDEITANDVPERGNWGGVILLGEASTNQRDANGDIIYNNQIEGVPRDANPAQFGGGTAQNEDDFDNSGTVRYVSIRHGGFAIAAGDEINGFTMGAVGRGTTINHVEVYANDDDGFEWFGGTVHTDHLVAAWIEDDGFDYDQGFRGTGQFWFSIHETDGAGRSGEHDGSDAGALDDTPFARPVITNATYIGSGKNTTNIGGDGNDRTFALRDGAGGEYYNSVFTDFPNVAVNLEDDGTAQNYANDDVIFENNAFFRYDAGSSFGDIITIDNANVSNRFDGGQQSANSSFSGNLVGSSLAVKGVDRNQLDGNRELDPRPTQMIASQSTTPKSEFVAQTTSGDGNGSVGDGDGGTLSTSVYLNPIVNVDYHGAFDPDASSPTDTWLGTWTAIFAETTLLPVELADFEVTRNDESFVLSWTTASETNNAGFDVQRSVDGGSFETIGFREGVGTTEQAQTYRFTDANVPFDASTVRYRLRQKDLDGSTSLSPVRTIDLGTPEQATLLNPFPNPAPQRATIQYQLPENGTVELSVYNVLGQRVATLVNERQTAGSKQLTFDTSSLSSGTYLLRLRTQGTTFTRRLTVVE